VPSWDRSLEDWIVAHRVGVLDPFAQGLSHVGTDAAIWLAIALLASIARRRAEVIAWTACSALLAWASAEILKALTDRPRPDVDRLVSLPQSGSLPSGHAATSFACATVLAALVPRWRVPFFALAVLIAWSRTYVGVHYPLDVLAGAVLGVALGLLVLRVLRPLAAGRRRSRRPPPAG
jgi:undecaprenyl-diphosphatase